MTEPTRTRRQLRVIENAVEIVKTPAAVEEVAYLARELVMCTLPHRNPGDAPAWSRTNGNLTLTIRPGWDGRERKAVGYPYGIIPRLVLYWINTEALRTKSRRLELGDNLAHFMREVGLSPETGRGKRGDARRLQEQMTRLFRALISFQYDTVTAARTGQAWLDMQVAPEGMLWWDPKNPQQTNLWGSWIELGEKFFQAITAEPIPLDIRILRHIKQSPLALDLYAILTREAYRVQKKGQPRFLAWEWLHSQIGTEYGTVKNFKQKALLAIEKIITVYPELIVKQQKGRKGQKSGLVVSNLSRPSIPQDLAR